MKKYIFCESNPFRKEIDYQIFNSNIHDTKLKFYWTSAICTNCNNSAQIAIPQKQERDPQKLAELFCPKCCVKKLQFAKWNGSEYVRLMA